MDPGALIPTPDAIPAPALWFHILLLDTFVLHLLLMNAMLGGGVIVLIHSLKPTQAHTPPGLELAIAKKLPYAMAFTVNLGVPPLLFLQVLYGHLIYTSSVLMAAWWVAVFLLVMTAYYGAYLYELKYQALSRARYLVMALCVACLLAVGFIFTNNMTLMLKPEAWTAYFDNPRGTVLNWGEPTLIPRYLHFVIASLAVGGLAVALLGWWHTRRGLAQGERLRDMGLHWFTWATLAQLAGGVWFLFSQPLEIMLLFLGGDAVHTAVLWAGVTAALAGAGLAMKHKPLAATLCAVAAVSLMVITRDFLRAAYLEPHFSLEALPVATQYSPALLFAGALAVGLMAVVWMLKEAARAGRESRP